MKSCSKPTPGPKVTESPTNATRNDCDCLSGVRAIVIPKAPAVDGDVAVGSGMSILPTTISRRQTAIESNHQRPVRTSADATRRIASAPELRQRDHHDDGPEDAQNGKGSILYDLSEAPCSYAIPNTPPSPGSPVVRSGCSRGRRSRRDSAGVLHEDAHGGCGHEVVDEVLGESTRRAGRSGPSSQRGRSGSCWLGVHVGNR